jgi:hypothetical protein
MGDGKGLNEQGFEAFLREAKCQEFCSLHPNPVKPTVLLGQALPAT